MTVKKYHEFRESLAMKNERRTWGVGRGTDFFRKNRKKLNKSIDLLMMPFNQLNVFFDRQCRIEFIVAVSIGINFDGQKV